MSKVKLVFVSAIVALVIAILAVWLLHDDFNTIYEADYVGSEVCGGCHIINHQQWSESPHHKITQVPIGNAVVGNFENGEWYLPKEDWKTPLDQLPAIKTFNKNGQYYMGLRYPNSDQYYPFRVDRVVGYQYRQTYLTKEEGGVLRRLPVQWSVPRGEFFAYWNEQEKSIYSVADLWAQMKSLNSAWNLYCARCHTTALNVVEKTPNHSKAKVEWSEPGVGCETCHGPGSMHIQYMAGKPTNRLMSFFNQLLNEQTAPYIMNASRLEKGVALSVCARCHGSDIKRKHMDIYRTYEPGFDEQGRLNDLSKYFKEAELQPGSNAPTVEVWIDGRPKGLGTLFRSFADSRHYDQTDMRCYDCHNAHDNKQEATPGLKQAGKESNEFCLGCHEQIKQDIQSHTKHAQDGPGSNCYDCHMPKNIANAVAGDVHFVRTHNMGSIPNPYLSARYGLDKSPNACNDCHADKTAQWAVDKLHDWKQDSHMLDVPLHLNRTAASDTVHDEKQLKDQL